jgi:hypothetical protein
MIDIRFYMGGNIQEKVNRFIMFVNSMVEKLFQKVQLEGTVKNPIYYEQNKSIIVKRNKVYYCSDKTELVRLLKAQVSN